MKRTSLWARSIYQAVSCIAFIAMLPGIQASLSQPLKVSVAPGEGPGVVDLQRCWGSPEQS